MLELYAPVPIRIGSSSCESLSSYVQRLAAANGTFPGQLAYRVLAWIDCKESGRIGQWARRSGRINIGRCNNCFGQAETWLRLLAAAVNRQDLERLTTNRWDFAFPTRGFQHATLHWCPLCLAEDVIPYHRLIWMLQPTERCLKHGVILNTLCPHCGRLPAVLHDRSCILNCPWCGSDLRDAVTVKAIPDDDVSSVELGTIISHFGTSPEVASWNFRESLRSMCGERDAVGAADLGRKIGTSKLTTWYWLKGKARPSLPMALRLYRHLGLSLASDLIGDRGLKRCPEAEGIQMTIHLRPIRCPREIDWLEVRATLIRTLECPLRDAPTFLSVSKALGIDRRTLRSHEPVLCRTISKRRWQRERCELKERQAMLSRQLRIAVLQINSRGVSLQKKRIEQMLNRPGLFNRQWARDCLSAVRGELLAEETRHAMQ